MPPLDLAAADEWSFVVTHEGVAHGRFSLASPGHVHDEALVQATLGRHAARARAVAELSARLRRRLGSPPPAREELPISVVVCTRRRPQLLREALESLRRLDPAPLEIVVVDNDPGANGLRALVEEAGARYVREDRRGLNHARAAGLRGARGELIAFTDDDCRVPPDWLRALPEHFADPTVGAVTGPGFPYEFETVYQFHRERVAAFPQSLRLRRFDWTNVWAVHSGRVGAGANMVLRRDAVSAAGDLFPPELDVGTRTRSGGDLYALYRILASGLRVVYDPGTYFLHRHGRDLPALRATVEGYGIGFSSFLTKALVEDREPATFAVWRWLWSSYVKAVLDLITGQGDELTLDLRRRYLRAGLRGPIEWPLARRAARGTPNREPGAATGGDRGRVPHHGPARPPPEEGAAGGDDAHPQLSVLVVAGDGPGPAPCLEALGAQRIGAGWEIVAVSPAGSDAAPPHPEASVRILAGPGGPSGINAAASSANAAMLLILDGSLRPQPGLLARHLERHRSLGREAVVIGASPARPRGRNLAALATRLASEDRHRLIRGAAARTFVDFAPTNISMPRELFERVGGFDAGFGIRAGWEWGARALAAGVDAVYEPGAVAHREPAPTTAEYVERAREAGEADGLLLGAAPEVGASVARREAARTAPGRVLEAAAVIALSRPRIRSRAVAALGLLEALRLRRTWFRLAQLTRYGAHRQGLRASAPHRRLLADTPPARVVDLDSDEPIPAPHVVAPPVELRWRQRRLAVVSPPAGHWHHTLFERGLAELDPDEIRLRSPADVEGSVDLGDAEVVFGPDRRRGDDRRRAAFEAAGARVRVLDDGRGTRAHWAALDRAVRESRAAVVALPMPGVRPSPEWLEDVVAALAGDRVVVAIGSGLPAHRYARPIELRSRHQARVPLQAFGAPAQFLAVRRTEYERLGGIDAEAAVVGIHGPVLDFVDRALRAGRVVAYCETPGLRPPGALRRHAHPGRLRRAYARGGLIALRAAGIGGGAGLRWFVGVGLLARARMLGRALISPPSTRQPEAPTVGGWLAGTPAYALGLAAGAVAALRRRARRARSGAE